MSARVRVMPDGDIAVVGHGTLTYRGTAIEEVLNSRHLGTLEGIGPASLSSLRQALIRWRKRVGYLEARVWVGLYPVPEEIFRRHFDDLNPLAVLAEPPPPSPALFLDGDELKVRIEVEQALEAKPVEVEKWLGPFLSRQQATCEVGVAKRENLEGDGFDLTVDLHWSHPRGATVSDAWKFGDEVQSLLQAIEDGVLPRSAAIDLLSAGRWDLFKGQPESGWLEAKGEPYDCLIKDVGQNWRYELAKDVAAFANAPEGGLIVLGLSTNNDGDGDVINGYKEFDLRRVKPSRYNNMVAQYVYPRVEGFEIIRVKGKKKGHGLVVLVIPPQLERNRPFLVQGTFFEGKVLGSHVLLPVRREDETALMDATSIHARLRLGEQVIAGDSRLPRRR
ncbi:MAG TPA: ATP-binding protein [Solirubrobacterales bacterium]|nr:ATP-binding protein [Solirubrobacterales bacterium]